MVHETKESLLQKSPTDSLQAQLSEHLTDDPEVVSSNPTGDNFLTKFILCCVTLNLSDNLTEMRIVKNSNVTNLVGTVLFEKQLQRHDYVLTNI